MRGKKITKSQKTLMAKLHTENMTHGEIAEATGLAKISIIRCLNHDKECKEMVSYLEQRYKDEMFNQSLEMIREGYSDVKIDGKTTLQMILEGYNRGN